jgi:2,3-bisphosphoglycerate-dependent phosphoglycerate mutase
MRDIDLLPERFFFLRHGVTDLNARGVTQGRIDEPLNDDGRAQACAAAERLIDAGVALIAASPMLRTHETATIVAERLGVSVCLVPGIEERDWGRFEGQPRAKRPIATDLASVETWEAFSARTLEALMPALFPEPVLVVAHAGTCRVIRGALGLDRDQRSIVPHAHALLFERTAEGRWHERLYDGRVDDAGAAPG